MSRRVDMTSFLCSVCGTSQVEMPVLNFRSYFLGKFHIKSFTYQYLHWLNQLINTESWILSWAGSLMSKLTVLQTKYPVLMIRVSRNILVVHLSPELLLSDALTCLPLDQLSPFHLPEGGQDSPRPRPRAPSAQTEPPGCSSLLSPGRCTHPAQPQSNGKWDKAVFFGKNSSALTAKPYEFMSAKTGIS